MCINAVFRITNAIFPGNAAGEINKNAATPGQHDTRFLLVTKQQTCIYWLVYSMQMRARRVKSPAIHTHRVFCIFFPAGARIKWEKALYCFCPLGAAKNWQSAARGKISHTATRFSLLRNVCQVHSHAAGDDAALCVISIFNLCSVRAFRCTLFGGERRFASVPTSRTSQRWKSAMGLFGLRPTSERFAAFGGAVGR